MSRAGEYAGALLLDVVGAGGALLVGSQTWQVVRTPRPAPLPPDVLALTGRTVDTASTALALVALAGVVAVLATRGVLRRVVGGVIALAGAALIWRAIGSRAAVSAARARAFMREYHPTVPTDSRVAPHVTASGGWPWLTSACGVLIVLAGALVATRGHHWSTLSARFDRRATPLQAGEQGADSPVGDALAGARPVDAGVLDAVDGGVQVADTEELDAARARAVTTMWNALDRGDDPTEGAPDAAGDDSRRG